MEELNFKNKVLNLYNDFFKKYGFAPNELWIGRIQETELDIYLDEFKDFMIKKGENILLPKFSGIREKLEFMNLKIRYPDSDDEFHVEYNQFYE